MVETRLTEAKSFLKWAGSKKWLIPQIQKFTPKKFNRYFEPFLGSGAIYFALKPKSAQLTDLNENVIATYEALKNDPNSIIQKLKKMSYDEDFYYYIRDEYKPRSEAGKAARIIYLNRTCWNGLYRENRKGIFNVPFGRYDKPKICDEDNLRAVAKTMKNATLLACDFEDALKNAEAEDLAFFDPPYITGHTNNGFHAYNEKLFKWKDQERLGGLVRDLDNRGCYFIVTNADNEEIRSLYKDFNIYPMSRRSVIAADITNRKLVSELVITNIHLEG
jgi:DNA adenine methylase